MQRAHCAPSPTSCENGAPQRLHIGSSIKASFDHAAADKPDDEESAAPVTGQLGGAIASSANFAVSRKQYFNVAALSKLLFVHSSFFGF